MNNMRQQEEQTLLAAIMLIRSKAFKIQEFL